MLFTEFFKHVCASARTRPSFLLFPVHHKLVKVPALFLLRKMI